MQVTTAVVLDTRAKRKTTNDQPVCIRVTFNRVPVLFPTGPSLCKDDFEKLASPRLGETLAAVRSKINEAHERAKQIIKELEPFDFAAFRERYYAGLAGYVPRRQVNKKQAQNGDELASIEHGLQEPTEPVGYTFSGHTKRYGKRKFERVRSKIDFGKLGPLAVLYGNYIKQLEREKRVGTSESYFSSLMSLLAFHKGLRLSDITKDSLFAYEDWMIAQGRSLTTVGIYLRPLRTLFNIAIEDKLISKDLYPFGRRKYRIPTGKGVKKALSAAQVKTLYEYRPEMIVSDWQERAPDMWFFMFFGNGMNPKDLAHLKYKNMNGDYLRFVRQKTKNTTRTAPPTITVFINDDMRATIKRWGNPDTDPENYIFPILVPGLSAHRVKELIQYFIKSVNKWMGKIAIDCGLDIKPRCMEIRHTAFTIMKRAGASIEAIQEAAGHMNSRTTQSYLDSFEDESKKALAQNLLAFKSLPPIASMTPEVLAQAV
ncbi:MAG TPA: phage integrase SAM-like domain-containing protein [Puia sp.]